MSWEEFLQTKHFGPSIFRPYADFIGVVSDMYDNLLGANPEYGRRARRLTDRDVVLARGSQISLLAFSKGMQRHLPTRQFLAFEDFSKLPEAEVLSSQPIEGLPVLLTNDSAQRVLRQVGLEDPTAFLLPNGYENIGQKSADALKSLETVSYGLLQSELARQLSLPSARAYPIPGTITESIEKFRTDYPAGQRTAFLMMQFGNSVAHKAIVNAIREALKPRGITALRADDKQYHDDVFPNVQTYLYGCDFGIAVFERIEADAFNPNVALEVGYCLALDKPVCFLKDRTLKTLQTDLVGKLYREFDAHQPAETIAPVLLKWLEDKGIGQLA
jgi:hypothetical protein